MEPMMYLKPFLGVIRSEETSGPITGAALSSINKFLSYGFIHEGTPNAAKAMSTITEIVTHCRFEATAPDSDEVVLATILDVLLTCLKCPAGFMLSDEMVMEMIQTCFRMSVQSRMSELLRKRAERTLLEMVQTVFTSSARSNLASTGASEAAASPSLPVSEQTEETKTLEAEKEYVNPRGIRFRQASTTEESGSKSQASPALKPHGVPCIIKLFSFICSLTQPSRANSETIRLLGLSLVNTALDLHSRETMCSILLPTVQEELCRNLLLNLVSNDLMIFTLTLRVFYIVYVSYKSWLKLQMEAFFLCLLNSVMEAKGVSYEKQELALECLTEFSSEPYFMIDLFANYDCDIQCANLFEQLCKFLYKNVFPVNGVLYTIHALSLDTLLALMQSLADRCKPAGTNPLASISVEELVKRKHAKRLLLTSVEHWNRNTKEGIQFLQGVLNPFSFH